MSGVIPFHFETQAVRVVQRNGDPWFVAADIAKVLDIGRTDDAVRRLDDDERGTDTIRTHGGDQDMVVINESGLYSLVLTSRKEAAKRFKKWITAEVIPSIRRTGGYGRHPAPPDLSDPVVLTALLVEHAGKRIEAEQRAYTAELVVDEMRPKVEAHDRIAESHGTFCRSTAAKMLGVPPQTLIRWLKTHGWTYRRPGTNDDIAYQPKITAGYLDHKITTGDRPDGSRWSATQVRITPKGMTVLARAFPQASVA